MSSTRESITVVSAGDVMFHDRLPAVPCAATAGVQAALAYLKQADICFVNCEMSLTRRGYPVEKKFNIRSDPAIAHDLKELGIHAVTLANNHMLDYGYEGLIDTLDALDSAGIARVGAGRNIEEALLPSQQEVNGKRFALLGVASTLPLGSAASSSRPGVAPVHVVSSLELDTSRMAETPGAAPRVRTRAVQEDVDRVTEVIAAAKKVADHIIVSIHWGTTRGLVPPRQGLIADYQPPLGRALIDAGADMVIGHHSHNLHGVEVYRSRPIFYSLGHFAFQRPHEFQDVHMEPETALVLADFTDSHMRVRLVPVLLNADGFPEVPPAAERDRIARLITERSKEFGTQFVVDVEGIHVQLRAAPKAEVN